MSQLKNIDIAQNSSNYFLPSLGSFINPQGSKNVSRKFKLSSCQFSWVTIVSTIMYKQHTRHPMKQDIFIITYTLVNCPLQKSSGLCKGSITNSFRVSFTFSRAPISSNVTPISLGGITSAKSLFSNSFSVTTS